MTTKPSLPGQIRIKGDFVANAAANGAFVIIYSLTDYSDVHYIAKQAEETIDINIMNLPGTEYNVSVFSLENGLPFERAVTSTKRVTVTTTGGQGLQCDNACTCTYISCHPHKPLEGEGFLWEIELPNYIYISACSI